MFHFTRRFLFLSTIFGTPHFLMRYILNISASFSFIEVSLAHRVCIPSPQFFTGLPLVLRYWGFQSSGCLSSFSFAIGWIWPYQISWFLPTFLIIVPSSLIRCVSPRFLLCLDVILLQIVLEHPSHPQPRILFLSVKFTIYEE